MTGRDFGPREARLRETVEASLDTALGPGWRGLPLGAPDGVSTALRALIATLAEHNKALGEALQSRGLGLTGF